MDPNKRLKLRDIRYEVRPACGVCVHYLHKDTGPGAELWSTCRLHSYDHQKHTEKRRHLSVHATGWCPDFTADTSQLGGFEEFYQKSSSGTHGRVRGGCSGCGVPLRDGMWCDNAECPGKTGS
jgi:hypothetical protein